MITEISKKGLVLRVRLTPNSSSCLLRGIFIDASGEEYLKINVVSVPEKGKANAELLKFLAAKLKLPKADFEIISGETDRYKKILISGEVDFISNRINEWLKKENIDER